MPWKKGNQVADDIWDSIEEFIPQELKQEAAEALIDVFEDHGAVDMSDSVLWGIAERDVPSSDDDEEDEDEDEEDEEDDDD